jgi:hypothetical protein
MAVSREYKLEYEKSKPDYIKCIRRKSYLRKQIKNFTAKKETANDIELQKVLDKLTNYENQLATLEAELVAVRAKYSIGCGVRRKKKAVDEETSQETDQSVPQSDDQRTDLSQ